MFGFLLVVGVPLGIIVAIIGLMVRQARIHNRLTALERQIKALQDGVAGARSSAREPAPPRPVRPEPEPQPAMAIEMAPDLAPSPWPPENLTEAETGRPRFEPVRPVPDPLGPVFAWLKSNWVLAISALSMGLAGVFLVQYGIEQGLLTPWMRVIGAILLGAALIAAGEWLRRRFGDADGVHTARIPSVFSAAGLVSLSAGVLSGHLMYGLFGPWFAFAALLAIAVLAVALGWFYGPLLAGFGIAGAMAVPFAVAPDPSATPIYGYLALITMAGLFIDTVRRWAWVSVLALVLGFGAGFVVYDAGGSGPAFLAFAIVLTLAATSIPVQRWQPDHAGPGVIAWQIRQGGPAPAFPVFLSEGALAAATLVVFTVTQGSQTALDVWLGLTALAVLFVIVAVWFRPAPGLTDLVILPPLAFLAIVTLQGLEPGPLAESPGPVFEPDAIGEVAQSPKGRITLLLAGALVVSALAAWRGIASGAFRRWWSVGAALFAPLVIVILQLAWQPAVWFTDGRAEGGDGPWAFHVIAVAALMVLFAERTARADGRASRRVALYVLSAITMIAFALSLVLGPVPLTLAMGVMGLAAALLDRRFDMDLMGVFIAAGCGLIFWRLGLPNGIATAAEAPFGDMVTAYGGILAVLAATALTLHHRDRWRVRMAVEAVGWTLLAIFATLLVDRVPVLDIRSHEGWGAVAALWLLSAAHIWWRSLKHLLPHRPDRILAVAHLFIAACALLISVSAANPLFGGLDVAGPLIIDTLFLAYLLPALVLAGLSWRLPGLPGWARIAGWSVAGALATLYVGLEIRRFWQGDDLSRAGVSDGELYSYTVAMLIGSAGVLYAAFARRSTALRRVAMAGIGLTIAKVFLVDMAGLSGLIRVASFLGLGLALAALAWLDRRIAAQWDHTKGHRE